MENKENKPLHFTSIHVNKDNFNELKKFNKNRKRTFNKFVDKCMDLYLKEESFRTKVDNPFQ